MRLDQYSKGDRYLISYISDYLVQNYHVSPAESLEWINNSFLLDMLEEDPLFIHHEDPDTLSRDIAESNRVLSFS